MFGRLHTCQKQLKADHFPPFGINCPVNGSFPIQNPENFRNIIYTRFSSINRQISLSFWYHISKVIILYIKIYSISFKHDSKDEIHIFPYINPFHPSVACLIETSHLISTANQMSSCYMNCSIGLKWVQHSRSLILFKLLMLHETCACSMSQGIQGWTK